MPLPARVVATFKESAALIILTEDTTQEDNRPPMVFLLNDRKPALLGREEGMDIELADPVVSRRHAEIFPEQAGFYIRDLGSSNGVLVNQTKIDNPYRLSHGDHVSLGGCMLYFVDLRTMAETMVRAPLPPVSEKIETSKTPCCSGQGKDRTSGLRVLLLQLCRGSENLLRVARSRSKIVVNLLPCHNWLFVVNVVE